MLLKQIWDQQFFPHVPGISIMFVQYYPMRVGKEEQQAIVSARRHWPSLGRQVCLHPTQFLSSAALPLSVLAILYCNCYVCTVSWNACSRPLPFPPRASLVCMFVKQASARMQAERSTVLLHSGKAEKNRQVGWKGSGGSRQACLLESERFLPHLYIYMWFCECWIHQSLWQEQSPPSPAGSTEKVG